MDSRWIQCGTVYGRNPARKPVEVGSLSTIIYKVLYIPGAGLLPSTVSSRVPEHIPWVEDEFHIFHEVKS